MAGKRNGFSRKCAILLAIAMVFGNIPQTAYANEVTSVAKDGDVLTGEVLVNDDSSEILNDGVLLSDGESNDIKSDEKETEETLIPDVDADNITMVSDNVKEYDTDNRPDVIENEGAVHGNWSNIEYLQYGRYRIRGSWNENKLLTGNSGVNINDNSHKKEQLWIFSKPDSWDEGYNPQELYVIYPYTDTNWSSPSKDTTPVLDAVGKSEGLKNGDGVGFQWKVYGTGDVSLSWTNKWMIGLYENSSEKDGYVFHTGTGTSNNYVLTYTENKYQDYPITMQEHNTSVVAQIQHWFIDPAYLITAATNNSNYGTVSISGGWECAIEGEQVNVTTDPKTGYQLDKLTYTVNGSTYDITSSKSFSMPAGDVEVKATFSQIPVVTPVITSQPTDLGLYAGQSGKLSIVATVPSGYSLEYQWQSSPNNSTWTDISNAKSKDYGFTPTTEGKTYYRCLVHSKAYGRTSDDVISDSATVTVVKAKPVITSQPTDLELYAGQTGKLSIVATGQGLEYIWQRSTNKTSWTDISGAKDKDYTFNTTTEGTTYYMCLVRSKTGSVYSDYVPSDVATVTVTKAKPVITSQPTDLELSVGVPGKLSIVATVPDKYSLEYLWESSTDNTNWTEIADATKADYTITPTTTGTTYYRCKVLSKITVGQTDIRSKYVDSAVATVTVTEATPVITSQPADLELSVGVPGKLSIVATVPGEYNLEYLWESSPDNTDWTVIQGATEKDYTFTPTTTGTTYYRCKVRSKITVGQTDIRSKYVDSTFATVTVKEATPVITSQPTDLEPSVGVPGKLSIVATAPSGYNLEYLWESSPDNTDWTVIQGATEKDYTFTPTITGTTYYRCKVRSKITVGQTDIRSEYVDSTVATVTVTEAKPVITSQPTDLETIVAVPGKLSVVATVPDKYSLEYQWESSTDNTDWTVIQGATEKDYTFTPIATGTTYYRCKVRSKITVGQTDIRSKYVDSTVATVTVSEAKPVITSQPADLELYAGSSGKLSIVATGPSGYTLEYLWESSPDNKNWTVIQGATEKDYTFTPTTTGTTYYRCKVRTFIKVDQKEITSSYEESAASKVTVKEATPVITSQPTDLNLTFSESGILSLVATAPEGYGLTYQWEKKVGNDYVAWTPDTPSAEAKSITYVADNKDEVGTNTLRCKVISTIMVDSKPVTAETYSDEVKLVVAPKAAEITKAPLPKTLSFNTAPQPLVEEGTCVNGTMNYAVLEEGKVPDNDTAWSTTIPAGTNVGKYYVWYKAKAAEGTGYKDSQADYVTSTIDKIETGIEVLGKSLKYSGDEQVLAEINGTVPDGVTVSFSMDGDKWNNEIPKKKDAGVYTVFWMVDGGDNYLSSSGRVVSSIGRNVLTVNITNYEGIYDGKGHSIKVGVTNADAEPVITYSLVKTNPIYENSVSVKDVTDGTEVYFRITDKKGNYEDYESNGTVKITPKTLTVTATANTITYGDAPAGNGVTYDGFAEGDSEDDLTGTPDYDFTYSQYGDVGNTYEITPKGLNGKNYTMDYKPGILTVVPKEIGLDWGEQTTFVYNGELLGPDPVATGTVNSDKIQVAAENNKNMNPGQYTATAKSLTGAKAGNYVLPQTTTSDYTIVKGQSEIITPPTEIEGLVYDSTPKKLVSGNAVAKNGKIQYSVQTELVDDQTILPWSDLIPEETNAKTYYVYFRSKGDPEIGYEDAYCKAPVTVTIDKAAALTIDTTPIVLTRSVNKKDLKDLINGGEWPDYYGIPAYSWKGAANVATVDGSVLKAEATTGNGFAVIGIPESDNAYGTHKEIRVTVNGQNQDDPEENGTITASFADELEKVVIGETEYSYLVYTGEKLMPEIIVQNGTKTLVPGKDYNVKYSDNIKANAVIGYEGTADVITGKLASVTVQGKGDYNDKDVLYFLIAKADIEAASAGNNVVLAGQKASPILSYMGNVLRKDRDYTGDFSKTFIDPKADNKIEITGKGNFIGTKTVRIVVVNVKRAIDVSIVNADITYNGEAHTLTDRQLVVKDKGTGAKLTEGEDYTVTYSNNTNAGSVKVLVTGLGTYQGKVSKTFKIKPAKYAVFKITNEQDLINKGVDFANIGVTPEVYVTADLDADHKDISLVNGKDFTISYGDNKKVGYGKATIKFTGNYKGAQSIIQHFKINKVIFENGVDSGITVANNLVYNPSKNKMGAYFPKAGTNLFVVMNGVLIKSSECTLSFYSSDDYAAEHLLTKDSPVTFGEGENEVTVYVKAEPNPKSANYNGGALTGSYRIVKGDNLLDVSKAKISIVDKNTGKAVKVHYTGQKVGFAGDDQFSQGFLKVVIKNGKQEIVLLENGVGDNQVSDFFDIEYVNNVRRGTAYVLISAKDKDEQPQDKGYNFVGSAKGSFRIGQLGLKELLNLLL